MSMLDTVENAPMAPADEGRTDTCHPMFRDVPSTVGFNKLRKRLFEIASEQGLDEDQVRSAVVDRTGKSIDDLTADELGPLVEAAANKLRQMKQEQAKAA